MNPYAVHTHSVLTTDDEYADHNVQSSPRKHFSQYINDDYVNHFRP